MKSRIQSYNGVLSTALSKLKPSSADFDKCLSIDGDSQGVGRLIGALSASYVAWDVAEIW